MNVLLQLLRNGIPTALAVIQLLVICPPLHAQVYEKVFDFTQGREADTVNKGRVPYDALVQGVDGNFYGTTRAGGANGWGTVYKMTPSGTLTTLVEFTQNGTLNKGSNPYSSVIQGIDGNFYGSTRLGGASGNGTIFKMTPSGQLTTLVEFTGAAGGNPGASPSAGLIQTSDGSFYGTTAGGGASGAGTVFKMTPDGVLTTLVQFTDNMGSNKGKAPTAALVLASDGNFYGTTALGGAFGYGTIFKMTPPGVLTTLVQFTDNGASNAGRTPYCQVGKPPAVPG